MLLISDLHFTEEPADEYRWKIFEFVHDYYVRTEDKNLLILGDLTNSKDHHPALLVNQITSCLIGLRDLGMEIFILKGNHDYIDEHCPFFGFLNEFEYINYITYPATYLIEGKKCLFLPHTRQPLADWAVSGIVEDNRKAAEFVFMHESVIGSVTSNGYEMETGLPPSYFKKFPGEIFSGDIHCPQQVGRVIYVGTPYSIRFNDHFRGRAIALHPVAGNWPASFHELFPDIMRRWTIEIKSAKELYELTELKGCQVKLRVPIRSAVQDHWHDKKLGIELACKELGIELCSLHAIRPAKFPLRGKARREVLTTLTPAQVLQKFAKQKGIDAPTRKAGRKVLEEK